jgi:hypothetical protein
MPLPEGSRDLQKMIEADVRSAFGSAFSDVEIDVPEPFKDRLPIGTGPATAVPWRLVGFHTGTFQDVRATGFPVEFTGATFLLDDPDGVRFVRFVDWHTLYRQLGLLMVCRRPQTPATAKADDADQPVILS